MTKQHVFSQVPGNTIDENLEIKHSFITKLFLRDRQGLSQNLKNDCPKQFQKFCPDPDLGT